jgi:hypothetical protein
LARVRVADGLALARAVGFAVGLFEGGARALAALCTWSAAALIAVADFVCFAVADFDFAFGASSAVAAFFVARTRFVRRTLDAAAMRRSPFRKFQMGERGSPKRRR